MKKPQTDVGNEFHAVGQLSLAIPLWLGTVSTD